jgi:hypothetical protein
MGLLKKFLEVLGFEDKEVLEAQFDELYYQDVEDTIPPLLPLADRAYDHIPSQMLKALNEVLEQPDNKYKSRVIGELRWDIKKLIHDEQMQKILDFPSLADAIEQEDVDEAIDECAKRWKKERWGE